MIDLFNWKEGVSNIFNVRVTPKAASNRIRRDGNLIRVYVTAPPENGKANAAVIKLLAKELGVPKSSISIVSGHTSREKTIQVK